MSQTAKRKRVLIINYYWPPSGGVGVLRTLKFAKHLRQFGWEPVIFTAENAHYPSLDSANATDIPEGLEVIRQPILEPNALYAKLSGASGKGEKPKDLLYVPDKNPGLLQKTAVWLRANLFIPDARSLWIRPAVKRLKAYLAAHPVDVILSSGPPHTNTRIAYLLQQATGIPWVADWRDPWTQADYYQSLPLTRWGKARHEQQEQAALQAANRTLIVSPQWAADLERIGAKNVHVLTNGYDPGDFKNLPLPNTQSLFTLTHLGIMGPDRYPATLLAAAAQICAENPDFKQRFRLQLIGQVDESIRQKATALGLEESHIQIVSQVPRREALGYAAASAANLLLLNQQANAAGRIPFKFFEYIALQRPIIGFGPADSDVNSLLKSMNGQVLFQEGDIIAAAAYLRALFQQFQSPEGIPALSLSQTERYSFAAITQQLAAHLEAVAGVGTSI